MFATLTALIARTLTTEQATFTLDRNEVRVLALSDAATDDPAQSSTKSANSQNPRTNPQNPEQMPPPCSPHQHAMVRILLEQRTPVKQIGPLVRPPVSYTTVLKMRRNYEGFGDTKAPKQYDRRGRAPKINAEMGEVRCRGVGGFASSGRYAVLTRYV